MCHLKSPYSNKYKCKMVLKTRVYLVKIGKKCNENK